MVIMINGSNTSNNTELSLLSNTCLYHALPASALQAEEIHGQAQQQSPQTPNQFVYKIARATFSQFVLFTELRHY